MMIFSISAMGTTKKTVRLAVSHRDACADISVRRDARLVAGGPRSRTTQGKGNERGALFGRNSAALAP
jgi:hypothetical protein